MRRFRALAVVLLLSVVFTPATPAAEDLCPNVVCGMRCMTRTDWRFCTPDAVLTKGCIQLWTSGCASMETYCCEGASLF